jgi:hypothetical protein
VEDNKHLWVTPGGMIFFKLAIPRNLRHHFRNKDKIVESTRTDSKTAARVFRDKRLGYWRAKFEHLEGGGQLGDLLPNEIAARTRTVYDLMRSKVAAENEADAEAYEKTLDWLVEKAREKFPDAPSSSITLARELVRAALAAERGVPLPEIPGASPAQPQPGPGGETFSQALAAYLAWLKDERQSREATVTDFRTRGQKFVDHAGDLP